MNLKEWLERNAKKILDIVHFGCGSNKVTEYRLSRKVRMIISEAERFLLRGCSLSSDYAKLDEVIDEIVCSDKAIVMSQVQKMQKNAGKRSASKAKESNKKNKMKESAAENGSNKKKKIKDSAAENGGEDDVQDVGDTNKNEDENDSPDTK